MIAGRHACLALPSKCNIRVFCRLVSVARGAAKCAKLRNAKGIARRRKHTKTNQQASQSASQPANKQGGKRAGK